MVNCLRLRTFERPSYVYVQFVGLTVLVHASFQTLGKSTSSALVAMRFVDRTAASSAARLTRVLTTLSYRALSTYTSRRISLHIAVFTSAKR